MVFCWVGWKVASKDDQKVAQMGGLTADLKDLMLGGHSDASRAAWKVEKLAGQKASS